MKKPVLLFALAALTACAAPLPSAEAEVTTAPQAGFVTDLDAFQRFIDTRPTATQFRARHPDVYLVMPGSITTKELRSNNSRYFAEFDSAGRIVGGKFQ